MQGLNNPIGIKSSEPNQSPFITNPYRFAAGDVGGWTELGRMSGSRASGATLDVSSLPDKRYYMVLYETQGSSTYTSDYRLNADGGYNYAYRASQNGTSETDTASSNFMFGDYGGIALDKFAVAYFANLNTKEKLGISHEVQQVATGATTAPTRGEYVHKHAQISNPISTISLLNRGPNTSASGEIVVLGWDPADTHTTNFWEELASVELSSGDVRLSSGTFTAKKYLWFQYYIKGASSSRQKIQFNGSSASDYAFRYSGNGGADSATSGTAYPDINASYAYANTNKYGNMFVINNATKEKLLTGHSMETTAGSPTAPNRIELAGKWANTSAQITQIDIWADGGSTAYGAGSIIKVWGSN